MKKNLYTEGDLIDCTDYIISNILNDLDIGKWIAIKNKIFNPNNIKTLKT